MWGWDKHKLHPCPALAPPDHVCICHFTLLHVGPPCELHELNRPLFTTMRIDRYDYKNPIIIAISSTCSQACSLPRPRASQRCANFEAAMIVMSPSKLNFTLLVYIRVIGVQGSTSSAWSIDCLELQCAWQLGFTGASSRANASYSSGFLLGLGSWVIFFTLLFRLYIYQCILQAFHRVVY
jgi:hypothetical protein